MIAFKCLGSGGRGRFSRLVWPLPAAGAAGAWVEAVPSLCATGVHACRTADLPYWLDAEIWRIELAGEVLEGRRKLVAARGRLLERVAGWDTDAAVDFGRGCAGRADELASGSAELARFAADVRTRAEQGRAASAGFIAARLAELAGGVEGYEAERAAQAAWLADRLDLRRDG